MLEPSLTSPEGPGRRTGRIRKLIRALIGLAAGSQLIVQTLPETVADESAMHPDELVPQADKVHQIEWQSDPDGHWTARTTGSDPWILMSPARPNDDRREDPGILTFEYRSSTGVLDLAIFQGPPWTNDSRLLAGNLPPSDSWRRVDIPLGDPERDRWFRDIGSLRMDFGNRPGVRIDIRKLRLREPLVAEEEEFDARRRIWWNKLAEARRIDRYLDGQPAARLNEVRVGETSVHIRGVLPDETADETQWFVLEVQPHEASWKSAMDGGKARGLHIIESEAGENFELVVPRSVGTRDRLTSRWQIVQAVDGNLAAASHARSPDEIVSLPLDGTMEAARPQTVKGITCAEEAPAKEDIRALGLGHASINVELTRLILDRNPVPVADDEGPANPEPELRWFVHDGQTWPIDRDYALQLDRLVSDLHAGDVRISMVLLLADTRAQGQRHRMVHPEATADGVYAMPNLADRRGAEQFEAVIAYLTRRFRPAPTSPGPVSNWIVHNEIDYAWTWTNMGEQPTARLVDVYARSLRLVDCLARHANPDARALVPLTHHWTSPGDDKGRTHCTVDLLRYLRRFAEVEGEFPWGIAHHPYPANLFNPVIWHDPLTPHRLDAERITLRNIGVLEHWLKLPEVRYRGEPRRLLLSEQGFHTPDMSTSSQEVQAAALAYAWLKLKQLTLVEAFLYHRLTDHPAEGGLNLGLRAAPAADESAGTRKRAWFLYQALGTGQEEAAIQSSIDRIPDVVPLPREQKIGGEDPTQWSQREEGDP